MNKFCIASGVVAAAVLSAGLAQAKSLRIENKRDVALSELKITAKDVAQPATYVLASDLAAGEKTRRSVPTASCLYDVRGTFSDKTTIAADDMDLCRQHTIRFVK